MRLGVDFTAQDLFRARYRERGNLVAQLLTGARYLLLDLCLGRRFLAIAFFLGGRARLVDELRGAFLRLREDLRGTAARLADGDLGLPRGLLERAAALVGGGETVRNGL